MRIHRIRKFPTKLILVTLIIFVLLFNVNARSGLKKITSNILSKPFKAISSVKQYFVNRKNLSEENLSLKQRLSLLAVELSRTEEISEENERLRALFKFEKKLPYQAIAARVIARDSLDWRKSVIINKGEKDGIKEHMPCVTTEGLLGSVYEVSSGTAKVMLITDPASKVGVMFDNSGESGVLSGIGSDGCNVMYISIDADIKPGDKIITAGFSQFFPRGLNVGTISKVSIDKTMLYKYAEVDTFQDMDKIEEVVCLYVDGE